MVGRPFFFQKERMHKVPQNSERYMHHQYENEYLLLSAP